MKKYNKLILNNLKCSFRNNILIYLLFVVLILLSCIYLKNGVMHGKSVGAGDYYFNIIKKLYVETYYKLTNDRVIIDLINNSNFYNVNTISSKLFSNIVPSEKNKSKIKKKNF